MPLARQVVKDLAVEHGACIRPIQLRRTNLDTGEVDTGARPVRAHPGPRLPVLRRTGQDPARCPVPGRLAPRGRTRPDPGPATEDQQWWVTMRAEAQQTRDQADDGRAGHGRLRRAHPRAG